MIAITTLQKIKEDPIMQSTGWSHYLVGAVSMTASIFFRAKSSGTASKHLCDVFNDDGSEGFPILIEIVQTKYRWN